MNIRLHANATTKPKIKAYIQSSDKSIQALADKLTMSVSAVGHCRNSDTIHYGSHTRKSLLATLRPAQEAIVIELRYTLLLDDFLPVVHEAIHSDLRARP